MDFKRLSENKETLDPKISESRKEMELSESEYKNILREQMPFVKSIPLEALREQNNKIIQETKKEKSGLLEGEKKEIKQEQMHLVKSIPLEALREQNNKIIQETKEKKPGLSEDERKKIKQEHPDWSDEVIDAIESWDEYEIYHKAGLKYAKINGKPCLIRTDIDMEQKDELGRTNKERMEQGIPPLDKNGKPIELHHIGQKADSPLAELTQEEHRGKGNDGILHDKTKTSEIDRDAFSKERNEHWEERSKDTTRSNI
jgi:hypothetical protein